jgi:hypothetical protein
MYAGLIHGRNLDESFTKYKCESVQLGPNEFFVTGTMKNWERWSDLPRISHKDTSVGG